MADSVSADPRIGSVIAGYRVERLLGRGGMSVVYLAEDTRLDRKVALKLLAPELAGDERFRERFLRESKLAASLDHPNVIPIFEAGETDGVLFIAMRYVEGTDLKRLLAEEGRLDPARAVGVLERVADALDTAHAQGLVHRDVKPANVLISVAGHVYLSDFGLTKQTGSESGMTETGQFMGTADYVAPEQIERRDVSPATDEYALACVLYECLTGEAPFRGESLMGVLWGHLNQDAAPATMSNPELPDGTDAVLAQGMAKDAEERYETCGGLVDEARSALGLSGELAAPVGLRSRRRGRWVAGAVVLVLVVVAAVVAAVLVSGGDDGAAVGPITGDSLVRVDPGTGQVAAVVSAGRGPSAVAAGERAVVSGSPNDRTVSIVDPAAGEAVRTVSVNGTPLAVAVDRNVAWVTSTSGGQGVLSQLDLDSGRVLRSADLGVSDPVGVAVGDGALWVAGQGFSSRAILRVDPGSLETVATIPTGAKRPLDVVVAHGAVWSVQSTVVNELEYEVSRIDPDTDAVVATARVPRVEGGGVRGQLAAGPEAVWVGGVGGDSRNEIWRIDPATNAVTETIDLAENDEIGCLAFADGSLWVTVVDFAAVGSPAYFDSFQLLRVDPQTGDVTGRFAAGEDIVFTGLAAGPDAIWAASATEASLIRESC